MTKGSRFKILSIIFLFFLLFSLKQNVFADEMHDSTTGTSTPDEEEREIGLPDEPDREQSDDGGGSDGGGEKTCDPDKKKTDSSSTQVISTEYKCSSSTSCEADILRKKRVRTTSTSWDCVCDTGKGEWNCGTPQKSTRYHWTEPESIEACEAWQGCSGGTDWSSARNACECDKECLDAPENIQYYDNPQSPIRPAYIQDKNNISLPIKLGWDDVDGWKDGNDYNNKYVSSYEVRINGEDYPVHESEYVPPSCVFDIDSPNSWKVRACCGSDGTNCSDDWSQSSFKANKKIELKSPKDPDWAHEEELATTTFPVTLKWCPVDKIDNKTIESYYFNIYQGLERELLFELPLLGTEYGDSYSDNRNVLFTINTPYFWDVAYCFDEDGENCGGYSNQWGVTVVDSLENPNLEFPLEGDYVNFYDKLSWEGVNGASSYIVSLKDKNGGKIADFTSKTIDGGNIISLSEFPLETIWKNYLKLNTEYQWQVMPCPDENAECEIKAENQSEIQKFKTTGKKPTNIDINTTIIPVVFSWDDVGGAFSYQYKIGSRIERFISESTLSLDYPDIETGSTYFFQVRACAKNDAYCGNWTKSTLIETFILKPPSSSNPENGEELFSNNKNISWESVPGAKKYIYSVSYDSNNPPEEELDKNCRDLVGREIIQGKITTDNSDYVDLLCLGKYTLKIQSCLDLECLKTSNSKSFKFTLKQPLVDGGGLVPCGRYTNNPNTPWNEMEKCEIKHIFLLFKSILDFLLWRVSLMILVLLTLSTGAYIYFAYTQNLYSVYDDFPNVMIKVKRAWIYAGQGYLIIFFAWTFLNLLLRLLGFSMGSWWQISF